MSGSRRSFPPPEDAAARYDAVLRRGRNLRRRRQLVTGAGAGGAVLALGLAVVLLIGDGTGAPQQAVSDPTTTTVVPMPDSFEMEAPEVVDGSLRVAVSNPAMANTDGEGVQCVYVRMDAAGGQTVAGRPVVAEGFDCSGPGDGIVHPIEVQPDGSSVGCAAMTDRPVTIEQDPDAPTTTTTVPVRGQQDVFELPIPEDLPAGPYSVTVEAVSGDGDGCATEQVGENEVSTSTVVPYP